MLVRWARSLGASMLAFIVTLSLCTAIPNGRAAADGTSPATPAAGDRGAPVAAPPAPVAAPVAARASGTFTLAQQSDWVSPAQPDYDLAVDIGTDDGSGPFELSVTVYRRLITRTGFAQAVAGTPGTVLDHLAPVAVAAGQRHPTASFVVSTGSGSASSSGIDLDCSDICSGVYPVVVSLQNTANGDEVGRLNTFLTYAGGASTDPLRFALVVPISASVRFGRQTATGGSLLAPPPAAVNALAAAARTLQARADVPTTLIVDPQTVQAMLASKDAAGHQAVATLGELSGNPTAREILRAPYVPIDLGGLAATGLTGEITIQMAAGGAALARAAIHTDPAATTWVAANGFDAGLAAGLSQIGASTVVVPDSSIATDPARLGVTQPFDLSSGHGAAVTAAVSDSGLDAHFTAQPQDPVLGAEQMLADLAFIQSEQPGALADTRGVIAVAPRSSVTGASFASFLDTLLAGLQGNPDVRAVTLDQFFAQVPVGGNGAPASRQAASTTGGSTISAAEATLISRARQRNDAFHSALPSGTPVLQSLDDLLLAAESDDIRSENRAQAVGTYEHALDAQLSQIELATERTITLTSRTGRIPITFLSSAPYPLVADVTLSSDKFEFPQGASFPHFTIAHSTNPLLVQVQARTSGDLPLTVTLTAPQTDPGAPPLVIAHGELTVRSTATSLVGILLTLLAIAVLVAWWVRTWRRGRRHAVRSGPPS